MILEKEQLFEIKAGVFSATLLNAIARVMNSIFEIGKSIGSSIRRIGRKNYC